MKKNRTLIIATADNDDFNVIQWKKYHDVIDILKPMNKFMRLIRRLMMKITFISNFIWFKKISKFINNYDLVIVFTSELLLKVPQYIRKYNKECKIIMWYWNPVDLKTNPNKINREIAEIWSFDKKDCENYMLNYSNQFYYSGLNSSESNIKYDIFFIGKDKGRASEIIKLAEKWKELDLILNINIIYSNNHINREYNSNYMDYTKIIDNIKLSKAILDLNQENQVGLTLRPLEALFFERKLITNNQAIIDYDFYNLNNIYVLGKDDRDISDFLNLDYQPIEHSIIEKYDFVNWVNRFYDQGV